MSWILTGGVGAIRRMPHLKGGLAGNRKTGGDGTHLEGRCGVHLQGGCGAI